MHRRRSAGRTSTRVRLGSAIHTRLGVRGSVVPAPPCSTIWRAHDPGEHRTGAAYHDSSRDALESPWEVGDHGIIGCRRLTINANRDVTVDGPTFEETCVG